jgi:hypothetical protein
VSEKYDTRDEQLAIVREVAELSITMGGIPLPMSRADILDLARAIYRQGGENVDMLDGLEDVAAVVRDVHYCLWQAQGD